MGFARAARAEDQTMPTTGTTGRQVETATFAGGCFWCMQPPYDTLKGVISTTVGYTGGTTPNPTYAQVSSGATGHAEAVQIVFDPATISYVQLLEVFWKNIDPTTVNQQFADRGTQYRTSIFYHSEEQQRLAEASKQRWAKSGAFGGKPIVTAIVPASAFYPAEAYHQQYYKQCPLKYKLYHAGSGREDYLRKLWGGASH
ncbi:MAG: peptide-methionine (S)-S-oxide reductase MsrA [Candidatus Omnitrophica bacterium]|nr:peptide-methionine (S)-S-oxide reductase MsrA [Candidatus Omnitrophota bacterium]MBI3083653.1 peptide-methionine (S)-S-oxide reductase MsrA [Candidatus Omnitrophota bacterium]